MQISHKNQKIGYQTPKLEVLGVFMALIAGSVIHVPIQLDLPSTGKNQ